MDDGQPAQRSIITALIELRHKAMASGRRV
jgi:hypothetical protein